MFKPGDLFAIKLDFHDQAIRTSSVNYRREFTAAESMGAVNIPADTIILCEVVWIDEADDRRPYLCYLPGYDAYLWPYTQYIVT